jgi:hypothetical protein
MCSVLGGGTSEMVAITGRLLSCRLEEWRNSARSIGTGAATKSRLEDAHFLHPKPPGDRWLRYAALMASRSLRIVVMTFPQVAVVENHEAKWLAQ